MTHDVLSPRALNRALLERQLLVRRSTLSPVRAIEHLVGLQAQIPNAPYIGLWTRLEGFDPGPVARLVKTGRAVRGPFLRGTLHLATARDFAAIRPLMQPVLERAMNGNFRKQLAGLNTKAVGAAGAVIIDNQPQNGAELGRLLKKQWPGYDARSLGYAVQCVVPVVQLPPRGVWGANGPVTWTTAEAWIGRKMSERPSIDKMVLRYLAAFGPATVMDIRAWSGVAGLRETIDRLRRRLRTFRNERGHELFDLPDAPRPEPDTPAPPRFLPFYDNALLGHADRTRVIADGAGARSFPNDGLLVGTVLLDGFLGARWKILRNRGRATLIVEHFDPLAKRDRAALAEEGVRLLEFAAADAPRRDVRIRRPA
jgi:DNA glycosylase AlkZ-like